MEQLLAEMGNRLVERRKQRGLTQEKVAELAGVTPQMISTAERGEKALRPENIVKICRALDISTDYLLTGKTLHDVTMITSKIAPLPPEQFRRLETIIDIFINAIQEKS